MLNLNPKYIIKIHTMDLLVSVKTIICIGRVKVHTGFYQLNLIRVYYKNIVKRVLQLIDASSVPVALMKG